jgi:xanthine dehydrogenase accessory factor
VSASAGWDWLSKAHELAGAGRPFALVTVTGGKGSTPRDCGAKLIVEPDGAFHGTVGGGRLEALVLEDARGFLAEAASGRKTYPLCFRTNQCCGGAVEIFVELLGLGPQLYLFGAGHVGQALCQTLQGTAFAVHLVDERREWLEAAGLPPGLVRHGRAWRDFVSAATWHRERTYAVVMTHDHQTDLEIAAAISGLPARFIGLIGSTTKWDRFKQRLAALGCDPDQVGRIQCPIGRKTGKAPREVAISVAAELLRIYHER